MKAIYGCINILVLIGFLIGCTSAPNRPPLAHRGIIDLRSWDMEHHGPVVLDGEWEFYRDQLLTPEDFRSGIARPPTYIKVPSNWSGIRRTVFNLTASKPSDLGYGTYRLRLRLSGREQNLALRFKEVFSCYTVYIDGKKAATVGVVGTTRQSSTPYLIPKTVDFVPHGPETEIIVQVANFLFKSGGLRDHVRLGTAEDIRTAMVNKTAGVLFLFGCILMIGLYHLEIYLRRRRDQAPLFFALFCFLLGMRTLAMDDRYLSWFIPALSQEGIFKVEWITWFLGIPVFAEMLRILFPQESSRRMLKGLFAMALVFTAITLSTSARINSFLIEPYMLISLMAFGYYYVVLIRAAVHRQAGSLIFLCGVVVMSLSGVNDMLYTLDAIDTAYVLPFGLFLFLLIQAYILSQRFAVGFTAAERLSADLEKANVHLAQERDALKRSEGELMTTRNFLRNVFDSLPSVLVALDQRGRVTQWNRTAELSNGIPPAQALGKDFWVLFPFLSMYQEVFNQVVRGRQPAFIPKICTDEKLRQYFDISFTPLSDDHQHGAVLRIDDVSEIEKQAQALIQAQRMEAVGNLAGGLAHDFNNFLGAIIGMVSILKRRLVQQDTAEILKGLNLIENSANRGADMVQLLLGLSRRQDVVSVPYDLNLGLQQVVKICNSTFDKAVRITASYHPQPAMIKAAPAQIEQAVLNLCINAAHAMTIMRGETETWGGELNLSIAPVAASQISIPVPLETHGDAYWLIRVSDTGIGMDEDTVSQIFEPFFSTKGSGLGTGLGLSMVYSIVHQHGGSIGVYSRPGLGTTFQVYLPRYEGEPVIESKVVEDVPTGSGLVLVIDDEAIMRETTRRILNECGYEVLLAASGTEGIETFARQADAIRAVILDMSMPGLSGKETLVELKKINPAVKVIIASGFRQDKRIDLALELGAEFIQKPFTLLDLAKKVRAMMEPVQGG